MTAYRAMRYGRHVDLILTDFHSYKMADPTDRPEAAALDFGRYPGPAAGVDGDPRRRHGTMPAASPPATIAIGDKTIPNFRKDEPPYTVLGREQKAWLKDRLTAIDRDLEDLGRDQRHARHADRSAEPARRA